ncbi:TIGR02466 family protein [Silicimonas sp. MF1-12-2]|uniref:TIGR02466 family protein n=1 Tax=Silicimonas sp. MF1-12-2 TaxID=3384793 RepID=UPI0039B4BA3B
MAEPEFTALWPTNLMRITLPGAEQANPVLAELIERMDAGRDQMTTDYLSGNFFDFGHPAVGWLKSCVERAVVDYARGTGVDYPIDFSIQAWPNVNRFGDYHDLHNHPHSWLSGTYYVRVPSGEDAPPGREDRTPNAISFFDPRPQANMLAIRNDPQVDPEHRILPEAGQMLIWPAFLHHMVHVNLSREARISVSFNIVLRWRNEYLP